jgi:hypothetical protein
MANVKYDSAFEVVTKLSRGFREFEGSKREDDENYNPAIILHKIYNRVVMVNVKFERNWLQVDFRIDFLSIPPEQLKMPSKTVFGEFKFIVVMTSSQPRLGLRSIEKDTGRNLVEFLAEVGGDDLAAKGERLIRKLVGFNKANAADQIAIQNALTSCLSRLKVYIRIHRRRSDLRSWQGVAQDWKTSQSYSWGQV